jgi:alpha-N-arabinofuranosidase
LNPKLISLSAALAFATASSALEYHVSVSGDDSSLGSRTRPFKTISAAVTVAQPGDVITVHAGIYREHVNPPRGGLSEEKRITYQAAPGESVVITGSEIVGNWSRVTNDTWKVALPNRYFGQFNPYSDVIRGDWFDGRGRRHHSGCVYLHEDWLIEATQLEDVV